MIGGNDEGEIVGIVENANGEVVKPTEAVVADPKLTEITVSASAKIVCETEEEEVSQTRKGSILDVNKELPLIGPTVGNRVGGEGRDKWGKTESCVDSTGERDGNSNDLGKALDEKAEEYEKEVTTSNMESIAVLVKDMASVTIDLTTPDPTTPSKEKDSPVEIVTEVIKEGEKPEKVKKHPASPPPPPPPPKDRIYLDTVPRIQIPGSPAPSTPTTPPARTRSPSDCNEFDVSGPMRGDSSSDDEDTKSEIHSIIDQFEPGSEGEDSQSTNEPYEAPISPILMSRTNSLSVISPRHPPRSSSLEALREIPNLASTTAPSSPANDAKSSSIRSPTTDKPQPQPYSHKSSASSTQTLSPAPPPKSPPRTKPARYPQPTSQLTNLYNPPPPEPDLDLPFDFHRFLKQLRDRSADPVAKYLRSFLYEFQKKQWTVREQVKIIRDFLRFIAGKMAQCEVWREVSEQEFDNAKEGMEKLVMTRLYHQTFSPLIPLAPPAPPGSSRRARMNDAERERGRRGQHQEDVERDEILAQKVKIYGWIREEHLDIAPLGESGRKFLVMAIQELDKMKSYKAPRDKIICVLNCCKVIFGLLRHTRSEESADEFIPLLIYVVLRTNPAHLVSNVEYILRFRNPDKLGGEMGYYLSSLMGAVQFIETLDRSSLTISDEEFEKNVEAAVAAIAEKPSDRGRSAEETVMSEGDAVSEKTPSPAFARQNGKGMGATGTGTGGSGSGGGGTGTGGSHLRHQSHLLDAGLGERRLRSGSPAPEVSLESAEGMRVTPRRWAEQQQMNEQIYHQEQGSGYGGNTSHDDSPVANLLRTIQKPLAIASSLFSSTSSSPAVSGAGGSSTLGPGLGSGLEEKEKEREREKEKEKGSSTLVTSSSQTSVPPRQPSRYHAEEAAARKASAETAEALRTQRVKHENAVMILVGMFPELDKEVISDVVREKEGRVDLAVDACLALGSG